MANEETDSPPSARQIRYSRRLAIKVRRALTSEASSELTDETTSQINMGDHDGTNPPEAAGGPSTTHQGPNVGASGSGTISAAVAQDVATSTAAAAIAATHTTPAPASIALQPALAGAAPVLPPAQAVVPLNSQQLTIIAPGQIAKYKGKKRTGESYFDPGPDFESYVSAVREHCNTNRITDHKQQIDVFLLNIHNSEGSAHLHALNFRGQGAEVVATLNDMVKWWRKFGDPSRSSLRVLSGKLFTPASMGEDEDEVKVSRIRHRARELSQAYVTRPGYDASTDKRTPIEIIMDYTCCVAFASHFGEVVERKAVDNHAHTESTMDLMGRMRVFLPRNQAAAKRDMTPADTEDIRMTTAADNHYRSAQQASRYDRQGGASPRGYQAPPRKNSCSRCGRDDHLRARCPYSENIVCTNCNRQGHMGKVCYSQRAPAAAAASATAASSTQGTQQPFRRQPARGRGRNFRHGHQPRQSTA